MRPGGFGDVVCQRTQMLSEFVSPLGLASHADAIAALGGSRREVGSCLSGASESADNKKLSTKYNTTDDGYAQSPSTETLRRRRRRRVAGAGGVASRTLSLVSFLRWYLRARELRRVLGSFAAGSYVSATTAGLNGPRGVGAAHARCDLPQAHLARLPRRPSPDEEII